MTQEFTGNKSGRKGMARKRGKAKTEQSVTDYRHEEAKRLHIPPAGLAAQGKIREKPKIHYAYNPHLPPVLRFDRSGKADGLPELLATARNRPLTLEEAENLAEALRKHEPWLEWAGKQEKKSFEVDPVALHIHERISAQAVLKVLAREDVQRSLFADPQLEYQKAVQFYQHDVDWSNRMILGDSLQVMASLAKREGLAGKVQMIFMDPPYGIKFSSNFQSEIGKMDVKDKESDLTREPEMVKAYQDTWTLGVHSYLAYLRDRLYLCKEVLADTGSIFVQISDENIHRLRCIMDEVFGAGNFISLITFRKKLMPLGAKTLESMADYLLWYAKDIDEIEYRQIYVESEPSPTARWTGLELADGLRRMLTREERLDLSKIPVGARIFSTVSQAAPSFSETGVYSWKFEGAEYAPPKGQCWVTSADKMDRLCGCARVVVESGLPRYVMFHDDFPVRKLTNPWYDTAPAQNKKYVVQTNEAVIARCLLMTTGPGDLVLDPTCGSGTTAYVAEHWGRRWITIDTSRVALALARQRLLTASFPFYRLKDDEGGKDLAHSPAKGFIYKALPHITLKSIAQNDALDPIFAKHEPLLEERLKRLNAALRKVTPSTRQKLLAKMTTKERAEGKKAITDADRRRWQLPKEAWKKWEVPFDTDDEWPTELKTALTEYRNAWQAKMDEVNACIAAHAEPQDLVDQPETVRGVARVSGPFSMEAVMPIEQSLMEPSPIGGEPEELDTFGEHAPPSVHEEPANAEAYLDKMLRLLKADGVRFPNNKILQFSRLERYSGEYLHGEGEWQPENGQVRKVAASFGPEFGPVTAYQVENAIPMAARRGFDDLVFAGFSFDAAAQAIIQEDPNPKIRCHLAHIRPDVNMGSLLKETPNSQLFTVFGSPRTNLRQVDDGMFVVEMEGVDIYNPVDNTILPTSANKVAAWFLDTDWDGRTFCITQAFFPDKSAWAKIGRSLKGVIDEERFAALSGTVSLPFPPGKKGWVAVKVIDPRGNEVMSLHRLPGKGGAGYEQK
jgi:adenine-specific DNA-methyltransferase